MSSPFFESIAKTLELEPDSFKNTEVPWFGLPSTDFEKITAFHFIVNAELIS